MEVPHQNPDARENAWAEIARPATLGGLHALRNAIQVVRAYSLQNIEAGPARDAIASGIDRILAVTEALEGLLGQVCGPPSPGEITATIGLFPELFVYSLRDKGLRLDLSGLTAPGPEITQWDLILLSAVLLKTILTGCTPDLGGKIILSLETRHLVIRWEPDQGTLPFPLVEDCPPDQARELATGMGLKLTVLPTHYGYCVSAP